MPALELLEETAEREIAVHVVKQHLVFAGKGT